MSAGDESRGERSLGEIISPSEIASQGWNVLRRRVEILGEGEITDPIYFRIPRLMGHRSMTDGEYSYNVNYSGLTNYSQRSLTGESGSGEDFDISIEEPSSTNRNGNYKFNIRYTSRKGEPKIKLLFEQEGNHWKFISANRVSHGKTLNSFQYEDPHVQHALRRTQALLTIVDMSPQRILDNAQADYIIGKLTELGSETVYLYLNDPQLSQEAYQISNELIRLTELRQRTTPEPSLHRLYQLHALYEEGPALDFYRRDRYPDENCY